MARKARNKSVYSTYLIKQYGGDCRQLFQDDSDRIKFIEILKKAKDKFGFKLYAYCLKEPNAYELIIYDNGSDISKIMKSINISYGMYAVCEGKLFHDRYKSRIIKDFPTLLQLTRQIHGDTADKWSSYCVFSDISKDAFDIIDIEDLLHIVSSDRKIAMTAIRSYLDGDESDLICDSQSTFCEDTPNCMTCKDDARGRLEEIAAERGMTVPELLKDKSARNLLIKQFRRESTLSLKALGELFGGISESTVCKILNQ